MVRASPSGQDIKTELGSAGGLGNCTIAIVIAIAISIIITILRYAIRGQTKNVSWSDAVIAALGQIHISQTQKYIYYMYNEINHIHQAHN